MWPWDGGCETRIVYCWITFTYYVLYCIYYVMLYYITYHIIYNIMSYHISYYQLFGFSWQELTWYQPHKHRRSPTQNSHLRITDETNERPRPDAINVRRRCNAFYKPTFRLTPWHNCIRFQTIPSNRKQRLNWVVTDCTTICVQSVSITAVPLRAGWTTQLANIGNSIPFSCRSMELFRCA